MSKDFRDQVTAQRMRDVMRRIALKVVNAERPVYKYGVVQTVNYSNGTCSVVPNGQTSPTTYPFFMCWPNPGQRVMVEGLNGDRFVSRVIEPGALPIPPGVELDYAGGTVPVGFFLEDHSEVSRTTYAALYAAIGTFWGNGNGTTTFNLPDSRGRSNIGAGAGPGLTARTLGDILGAETTPHVHTLSSDGQAEIVMPTSGLSISMNRVAAASWTENISTPLPGGTVTLASTSLGAALTGQTDSDSPSVIHPSKVVTKIIKY